MTLIVSKLLDEVYTKIDQEVISAQCFAVSLQPTEWAFQWAYTVDIDQ